jgi:hypothetical protein
MSSNYETVNGAAATHTAQVRRANSYSRKRWSAFDAWQEHIRKSAAAVGVAFPERHDRDMRRAIVTG